MGQVTLGIDIAYQALKIAALEKQGKKFRLVGINYAPIPKDSWQTDGLRNQEEIAKVLHDSLKSAKPSGISSKYAMFALPESVTYSITLAMPQLSKAELDQALPFEIAEKLSINLEEYLIDYEVGSTACKMDSSTKAQTPTDSTGTEAKKPDEIQKDLPGETAKTATPEKADVPAQNPGMTGSNQTVTDSTPADNPDQPQVAVFAVATKKSLIQSLTDFCELAHLELAGIDVKAGCIIRSLVPYADNKTRMIVDLGANATGINVAEGQSPRLISTVPLGTNSYPGKGDAAQLESFRTLGTPIFDEIVHVTKFYQNRVCPGNNIESVILTGGGSDIGDIAQLFTQETGLPTELGNPFGLIDTHRFPIPHELAHKYADSIGLAMRPLHD